MLSRKLPLGNFQGGRQLLAISKSQIYLLLNATCWVRKGRKIESNERMVVREKYFEKSIMVFMANKANSLARTKWM
jgi:uncharacterized membrane protein YbaN (DUF454 family)